MIKHSTCYQRYNLGLLQSHSVLVPVPDAADQSKLFQLGAVLVSLADTDVVALRNRCKMRSLVQ